MDDLVQELDVLKIDCNQNKADCEQNNRQLVATIEKYAKTVLSITWDQELVITSDDFRTQNSEKVMTSIQFLLDGIRQLCQELDESPANDQILDHNGYQSVRSLLGVDFAECLLWRKAGLLYAFCNCKLNSGLKLNADSVLIEDSDQLSDELKHKLLQYLIDGIQWFRHFLSQRQSFDDVLSTPTDQSLNSSEALIAHNIFSDNHLLSLMYLSEMCFWYQKYSNHWRLYLHTNGFDVEECAKRCLNLYINAVENHFKSLGWNCDKAKQLLHLIDV